MQKNALGSALYDFVYVFLFEYCLAVYHDFVSLDCEYLASVLVHEVLYPRFEYAGGEFAAYRLFQSGLADLNLVCKVENFKNLLVALEAYCSEERGDG